MVISVVVASAVVVAAVVVVSVSLTVSVSDNAESPTKKTVNDF